MKRTALLFLSLVSFLISFATAPPGTSGTLKIGPGGDYTTLTGAIDTLTAYGLSGPVTLELQSGYTSLGETFPITIPRLPGISERNQLTIQPAANAKSLVISPRGYTAAILLDGAQYVNIDGRPGGTGTTGQLLITSEQGTSPTIIFQDSCRHNSIKYTELTCFMTDPSLGIITMKADDWASGNKYNSFENCAIHGIKGKTVYKGIYSTTGGHAMNDFNIVKNCRLYDCGNYIYLEKNNSDWQIINNDLYTGDYKNWGYKGIYIADDDSGSGLGSGSGYVITDNAIGGSGPDCSGQKPSISAFTGIWIKTSKERFNYVQRNKIANVQVAVSGDVYYPFLGIYMIGGNFNCSGNTIGESDNPGNIQVTYSSDAIIAGIIAGGSYWTVDSSIINNNRIGGISCKQQGYNTEHHFYGIRSAARVYAELDKNYIGSATVKNSLSVNESALTGISSEVTGNGTGVPFNIVSNNLVANLNGGITGIGTKGGIPRILNNTVRNISATGPTIPHAPMCGLEIEGNYALRSGPAPIISGNVVHSIYINTGDDYVAGIRSAYMYNVIIERNLVHSIVSGASLDHNCYIHGISLDGSHYSTIRNNMVKVGLDIDGKNIPGRQMVNGIWIDGNRTDVFNNTVYVAGQGNNITAALWVASDSLTANVNNNVLVNTRTARLNNDYYNGESYVMLGNITTANYNNYYFNTGQANCHLTRRGEYYVYDDIKSWRKASGLDSNSFVYPPNFVNGTGNASLLDLHTASPSPLKGAGSYNSSVTEDFDGEQRDPSSPDIGADAGNYAYQDGEAPVLTHEAFLGQPVQSEYIYRVRIVDHIGGVDTLAGKQPRMWLRKSYPQKGAWFSVAGNKLSGSRIDGIWGFHPDLSKAGATLSPGDSLEYYFVAQDKGPIINIGYSNLDSTKHSDVNTQVAAPFKPARLLVYSQFPDTVYVGVGQQYTSLTNEDGFFQAANKMLFDTTKANVYVVITSDLAERGKYELTNLNKGGCIIHICTNTPVLKKITRLPDFDKRIIVSLSNVNNIIIDGRVNGKGRYIRFESLNQATGYESQSLRVVGTLKNITLTNLEFASNNINAYNEGTVYIGGAMTGIVVENNLFTNIDTLVNYLPAKLPKYGLSISGTPLSGITIRNNDFSNFAVNGIKFSGSYTGTGDIHVNIDSNHFYYNTTLINSENPVAIQAGAYRGILSITNNYIGGTERFCGGSKWTVVTTPEKDRAGGGYLLTGINVGAAGTDSVSIQGNVISNIRMPLYSSAVTGMYVSGPFVYIGNEKPNIIGSTSVDTSITAANIRGIEGTTMIDDKKPPSSAVISNNIFASLHSRNDFFAVKFNSLNLTVNKNKATSLTGATGNIFDLTARTGTISENTISNITFLASVWDTYGGTFGTGMSISQHSLALPAAQLVVERNSISSMQCKVNNAYGVPLIGIKGRNTSAVFRNNQISLGTTGAPAAIEVQGISITADYQSTRKITNQVLYNSIYLYGQVADTFSSHGIYINDPNAQEIVMNNIIYNNRTGGTGKHLALSSVSTIAAPFAVAVDNNLYITSKTGALNRLKTTVATDLNQWRTISGKDAASYATTALVVPPDSLFRSAATGDLDINTGTTASWLVNGKGMPIADAYNDFRDGSHIRSVEISTGATDIGSDEFNATTPPPVFTITGSHTPGGTEKMTYNGRLLATITWGNTGTLPTLTKPGFYSGEWPNDTTNNGTVTTARFMNGYWAINATGGSGYSYTLAVNYDSSMLGKISDASNMVLNKKESGVNGSWKVLTPSVVDTVAKTVTVYNQTSFSEFALTDSLATAVTPAQLSDIELTAVGAAQARMNTQYSLRYNETNKGTGYSLAHAVLVYLSADSILTPGLNGDSLLGTLNAGRIAAGAGASTNNLTMKFNCNLQEGQYYIIAQADPDNTIPESDKANNISRLKLQLLAAADVSFSSDKSSICPGEKIVFQTSNVGRFTFSGTAISNVNDTSFLAYPASPGIYTYLATAFLNGCTVTKKADIIVKESPQVTASVSSEGVCEGQEVTLTAQGATSYVWRDGAKIYSGDIIKPDFTDMGNHSFMLTGTAQNGCQASTTASFTVGSPVAPSVSIDYSGCPGKVLSFQAYPVNGGDRPQYKWYVNDQLKGTSAVFTLNDASNSMQVYVVMKSDAPCTDNAEVTSAPSKINCVVTAVPEIDGMEAYTIYPNPGEGMFYVRTKLNVAKNIRLLVADGTGNVIMVIPAGMKYGEVVIPVDLRNKPNGMYYIQATVGNKTFTSKVIKL